MNTDTSHKILLPRFDTIGDIVLIEGFLRELQKVPAVEITIIVRQAYASELRPIFSHLNLNWKTISLNPYSPVADVQGKEVMSFLDSIAAEKWNLVLFTTFNRTTLEDMIAARLVGVQKIGLGVPSIHSPLQAALFKRLGLEEKKLFSSLVPVEERAPETEKYQLFLKSLFHGETNNLSPRISLSSDAIKEAQGVIEHLILEENNFFICMPAGLMTIKIKAWPAANFAAVAKWAVDNLNIQPLIVGHESERELVENAADHMRAAGIEPHVWLGQGGDLQVLAALLKQAHFYVGNDSAPMHLAAAVGTPTVGIFGGGHWPRFVPVGKKAVGVAAPLPCFYCNWDCIFGDAPCVRLVSVKDVIRAINLVLSDKGEIHGNVVLSTNATDPATNELVEKSRGVVQQLRGELRLCRDVIDSLSERIEKESVEHSEIVTQINNSLSWRVTRPLRLLGKALLRRKK